MKTHKRSENPRKTLCGLNITNVAPESKKLVTDDPTKVTCLDCFNEMVENPKNEVFENLKNYHEDKTEKKSGTYTSLPIQPWHFAETNNLSFLEGCIVKRVCRHRQKDGAKDIDKAIQELELLKKHLYES